MSSKIDDNCFKQGKRAEALIMFNNNIIKGITRVYLLEHDLINGIYIHGHIKDRELLLKNTEFVNDIKKLYGYENDSNIDGIIEILSKTTLKYGLIKTKTGIKIYADKNIYNPKNIGGRRENITETFQKAFYREVHEELGFNIEQAVANDPTILACNNGVATIKLTNELYRDMLISYQKLYDDKQSELQSLSSSTGTCIDVLSEIIRISFLIEKETKATSVTNPSNEKNKYLKYKIKYLKYKTKYLFLKNKLR